MKQNSALSFLVGVETGLALITRGPDLLISARESFPRRSLCGPQKMSSHVTISAKRLTETRGGGTRTVNMIQDLNLHGPSSFCLQGTQSQGGGTVL